MCIGTSLTYVRKFYPRSGLARVKKAPLRMLLEVDPTLVRADLLNVFKNKKWTQGDSNPCTAPW